MLSLTILRSRRYALSLLHSFSLSLDRDSFTKRTCGFLNKPTINAYFWCHSPSIPTEDAPIFNILLLLEPFSSNKPLAQLALGCGCEFTGAPPPLSIPPTPLTLQLAQPPTLAPPPTYSALLSLLLLFVTLCTLSATPEKRGVASLFSLLVFTLFPPWSDGDAPPVCSLPILTDLNRITGRRFCWRKRSASVTIMSLVPTSPCSRPSSSKFKVFCERWVVTSTWAVSLLSLPPPPLIIPTDAPLFMTVGDDDDDVVAEVVGELLVRRNCELVLLVKASSAPMLQPLSVVFFFLFLLERHTHSSERISLRRLTLADNDDDEDDNTVEDAATAYKEQVQCCEECKGRGKGDDDDEIWECDDAGEQYEDTFMPSPATQFVESVFLMRGNRYPLLSHKTTVYLCCNHLQAYSNNILIKSVLLGNSTICIMVHLRHRLFSSQLRASSSMC